jgi:hypothetical protein
MEYHHLTLRPDTPKGKTCRVLYAQSPEGWYELNKETGIGKGYRIINQVVHPNGDLTLLVKKMSEGWVPSVVLDKTEIDASLDGVQLGEWVRRVEAFSCAAVAPVQAQAQAQHQPQQQPRQKRKHDNRPPVPIVQNPKQYSVPVQMAQTLHIPKSINAAAANRPHYPPGQIQSMKRNREPKQSGRCKIVI